MDKTLPELMADAARELQEPDAPGDTMETAVALAVSDIDGCDAAALSIVERRRRIRTPAATSDQARRGDELQYETGEGPCLDAIWDERTVHSPNLRTEDRWPTWGLRMADEVGFASMLCFQLFTNEETVGALNLYSSRSNGFDTTDRDNGLALAAHIAVAVRAAQRIEQLDSALANRSAISMAIGILMERYQVDENTAFAVLTRTSSHTNRKVREVAAEVVETRRLPDVADPSGTT